MALLSTTISGMRLSMSTIWYGSAAPMIISTAMRPFSAVSATIFNFFSNIFIIFKLDSESTVWI